MKIKMNREVKILLSGKINIKKNLKTKMNALAENALSGDALPKTRSWK